MCSAEPQEHTHTHTQSHKALPLHLSGWVSVQETSSSSAMRHFLSQSESRNLKTRPDPDLWPLWGKMDGLNCLDEEVEHKANTPASGLSAVARHKRQNQELWLTSCFLMTIKTSVLNNFFQIIFIHSFKRWQVIFVLPNVVSDYTPTGYSLRGSASVT